MEKNIAIYKSKQGDVSVSVKLDNRDIWATQKEIASAFKVDIRTINEHFRNIYRTKELSRDRTIRKFRIVKKEGKRDIEREIYHYNLDAILSVGYKVNSKQATDFRIWATKILRDHITKGFTINRNQVQKNYNEFMKAVSSIQKLLPSQATFDPKMVLDLVKEFSTTWVSLDAYDKGKLLISGKNKKSVNLTIAEIGTAVFSLKKELMKGGEATDLFATEREEGSFEGIVGNVMQSFGGSPLYKTVEEKAAHLLYFVVKNHPFLDGNKRTGAFSFIWFLRKTRTSGARNINPSSLTALTLLVAESDPKEKDQMIALITQLIS